MKKIVRISAIVALASIAQAQTEVESIMKKLYISILLLLLLLTFGLPKIFAQRDNPEERDRKITLKKNARQNGYKIVERGEGEFHVNILGATNPQNGKKLNGKYSFAYRCKVAAGLIIVAVILTKGYAEQKLRCRFRDDSYLYY